MSLGNKLTVDPNVCQIYLFTYFEGPILLRQLHQTILRMFLTYENEKKLGERPQIDLHILHFSDTTK